MTQIDEAAYIAAVTDYRARQDEMFATSPDSPLGWVEQQGFEGLSYFPPDLAYRVVASVTPFAQPETVKLGSTQGDVRPQVRFAELRFTLAGQELRLTGYQEVNAADHADLFVPFRDVTSGNETYGAGRYLEVEIERDTSGALTATLDFNLAYSPWCAYNTAYSCTLPPVENTLPIPITAGERTYNSHA